MELLWPPRVPQVTAAFDTSEPRRHTRKQSRELIQAQPVSPCLSQSVTSIIVLDPTQATAAVLAIQARSSSAGPFEFARRKKARAPQPGTSFLAFIHSPRPQSRSILRRKHTARACTLFCGCQLACWLACSSGQKPRRCPQTGPMETC